MTRDTAEYDVSDFDNPEMDRGVYARFYVVPKMNESASAVEGRPVFQDMVYVEIVAAGNSTNIIRKPAREMDFRRFRRQYELFKQGNVDQIIGTPLSEVPWITRSQVEELAYRKVRTLEELSTLSDSVCGGVPGLYELKRKAESWLVKAAEAAPFTAMQAKIDELEKRLAAAEAKDD